MSKATEYISEGRIKWHPLDDDYDIVYFGTKKSARQKPDFRFVKGREALEASLMKRFPEEADGIKRYLDDCEDLTTFFFDYHIPALLFPEDIQKGVRLIYRFLCQVCKSYYLPLQANRKIK